MSHLIRILNIPQELVDCIVFYHEDEEFSYERICRRLRQDLKTDIHYYVNLAGGTRYMALAVQQAFSKLNADFFYVNLRDNTIIKSIFDDSIDDDDDYVYPIRRRMTISEYLSLHGIQHDANQQQHKPTRKEDYVQQVFEIFSTKQLNESDYNILEILREEYRNNIHSDNPLAIDKIEHGRVPHCEAIPKLSGFLRYIGFIPQREGHISKQDVDFLTGGWFEEYCYYRALREFNPEEALIGVHIARPGVEHDNELDVIFIKENTLYVIECKSGIGSKKLFNEIIYKACALKEALLGLNCRYYLYSLKKDTPEESLHKIATNMGITFVGLTEL